MIITLLEGNASLKNLAASQATEVRAEGTVFEAPFGAAQGASAALLTSEKHFFTIDIRILEIADVKILEVNTTIKVIIASIDKLS